MTHKFESLGELAEKAGGERWITGSYGPKTIGVGAPGGPAAMLIRPNHGSIDDLYTLVAFIREANPSAILSLLADMKVMQEALQMASVYVDGEGTEEESEQVRAALQRVKGES